LPPHRRRGGGDVKPVFTVRDRSRRLAARGLDLRRSRDRAPRREARGRDRPDRLEIRVAQSPHAHMIRIELFGDLDRATVDRLSSCLENALETRAQRVILDLRGLDVLTPEAIGRILTAHLIAESEHRQLLLVPGSARVQRVLDRAQCPFSYLRPDDDVSLCNTARWPEVATAGRRRTRRRGRILDLLLSSADRLIAATEDASEPIGTFEYVAASALLSALKCAFFIRRSTWRRSGATRGRRVNPPLAM
jgi:anti-anti-sigma factor